MQAYRLFSPPSYLGSLRPVFGSCRLAARTGERPRFASGRMTVSPPRAIRSQASSISSSPSRAATMPSGSRDCLWWTSIPIRRMPTPMSSAGSARRRSRSRRARVYITGIGLKAGRPPKFGCQASPSTSRPAFSSLLLVRSPSAWMVPNTCRSKGASNPSPRCLVSSIASRQVEPEQEIEFTSSGKVAVSSRNTALWRSAIEYAPCVNSLAALAGDLRAHRDWHFENPETVSEDEVRRVSEWAWQKRLDNQIWSGRRSEVRFPRSVMDRLLRHKHGADAFLLYCLLRSEHGHIAAEISRSFPGRCARLAYSKCRATDFIERSMSW